MLTAGEGGHALQGGDFPIDRARCCLLGEAGRLVAFHRARAEATEASAPAEVGHQVRQAELQGVGRLAPVGHVVIANHLRSLVEREAVPRGTHRDIERYLTLALAQERLRLALVLGLGGLAHGLAMLAVAHPPDGRLLHGAMAVSIGRTE